MPPDPLSFQGFLLFVTGTLSDLPQYLVHTSHTALAMQLKNKKPEKVKWWNQGESLDQSTSQPANQPTNQLIN